MHATRCVRDQEKDLVVPKVPREAEATATVAVAVAAALVAEVSEVPVSKINPKRENIQMYA